MVTGEKPDLSNLHKWGCPVWVHKKSKSKLEGHAKEGCWMGFSRLSKFLEKPGQAHWDAAKRVFHYLKGTLDWRLTYGDRDKKLTDGLMQMVVRRRIDVQSQGTHF